MCKTEASSSTRAALISDAGNTASYVANALNPMLDALTGAGLKSAVLMEVMSNKREHVFQALPRCDARHARFTAPAPPATHASQVINEPEWCMAGDTCATDECAAITDMQRFVGAQASACRAKGYKVRCHFSYASFNLGSRACIRFVLLRVRMLFVVVHVVG